VDPKHLKSIVWRFWCSKENFNPDYSFSVTEKDIRNTEVYVIILSMPRNREMYARIWTKKAKRAASCHVVIVLQPTPLSTGVVDRGGAYCHHDPLIHLLCWSFLYYSWMMTVHLSFNPHGHHCRCARSMQAPFHYSRAYDQQEPRTMNRIAADGRMSWRNMNRWEVSWCQPIAFRSCFPLSPGVVHLLHAPIVLTIIWIISIFWTSKTDCSCPKIGVPLSAQSRYILGKLFSVLKRLHVCLQ
jgi:hypothetical protein